MILSDPATDDGWNPWEFFDAAPVGLHLQLVDGTLRRVNQAWLDLLGYRQEECIGRNWCEFHADPRTAAEIIAALRQGHIIQDREVTLRTKTGRQRFTLLSANVLERGGNFIYARCFTRDITPLKESQLALVDADRRKSAILSASLDAIITMDEQGRLVDFNQSAERIFGYQRHDAVGRLLADLIVPPELRQSHYEGLQRYLATGVAKVIGKRIEVPALHAAGHTFPVELSIAQVDGKPPLFTATLRDISERKSAEAALVQNDRDKDQFIAALAHELRNPLAPMRNAAALLSMAGLPQARQEWAVGILQRQISHMARLLDDLLDVGRITHGKLALQKQRIDLKDVVLSAMEVVQPLFDAKKQSITISLPTNAIPLFADPVRLAQVLSNLLINASKYSGIGDSVSLRAVDREHCLQLEIRDHGVGLSAEELKQLFKMFKQLGTPKDGPNPGLGVGLALSRTLVELHGGSLEAHSLGRGRGCTFIVTLPADAGDRT